MTIIQFQTSCLRLVFILCQAFHAILRETGEYIWTLCMQRYIALPIDLPFVCWLHSFVFVPLWNGNKSYVHFLQKKEWQVNLKTMKISIIVVQSFNIIVWPSRPFLKWPNLKCHVGNTCIYNTLWPTSRLITEQFQIPHWPYLFKRRKPWSTQQILFNG